MLLSFFLGRKFCEKVCKNLCEMPYFNHRHSGFFWHVFFVTISGNSRGAVNKALGALNSDHFNSSSTVKRTTITTTTISTTDSAVKPTECLTWGATASKVIGTKNTKATMFRRNHHHPWQNLQRNLRWDTLLQQVCSELSDLSASWVLWDKLFRSCPYFCIRVPTTRLTTHRVVSDGHKRRLPNCLPARASDTETFEFSLNS